MKGYCIQKGEPTPDNPIPIETLSLETSAKEMFEKLGYEYYENSYKLMYSKEKEDLFECIVFYKDDKTFYKQSKYEAGDITLEELQAINKQVEELEWR